MARNGCYFNTWGFSKVSAPVVIWLYRVRFYVACCQIYSLGLAYLCLACTVLFFSRARPRPAKCADGRINIARLIYLAAFHACTAHTAHMRLTKA